MRLSASRIRMYLTCPRQYRYHYVDGLPGPFSLPLAFGKAVHEALQRMVERAIATQGDPNPDVGLAAYRKAWERLLADAPPESREAPPTGEDHGATAAEMIGAYAGRQRGKPQPLAVEFRFEIPWREHAVTGFMDRIDEGERGLVITDFKTGRRKPSPKEVREDLQLTLYAHAAGRVFGLPVERVVLCHLRDGTDLVSAREESDFRRLDEEVLTPVVAGITEERFGPRTGWHCRFCDYKGACEAEGLEGNILPLAPPVLPDP